MPTGRFIGLSSSESDNIDNDFFGAFLWKSLISKKDRGIICDLTRGLSLLQNLHVCIFHPDLTISILNSRILDMQDSIVGNALYFYILQYL